MITFSRQRGYQPSVLNATHSHVKQITENQTLQPADKSSSEWIPRVDFSYFTAQFSKIVRQNLNILQADSTTRRLFPEPPFCTDRLDTSLRDQLVHSASSDNSSTGVVEQFGLCKRPRCTTISRDSIRPTGSNNQTFTVKKSFTSTTTNVVYVFVFMLLFKTWLF